MNPETEMLTREIPNNVEGGETDLLNNHGAPNNENGISLINGKRISGVTSDI